MDFFFTMDRKRKLGCVLFNNLLTSSRKRRRKEQDEFDAMYQSFEEPAEVIDDGEDDDIMGTIAYVTKSDGTIQRQHTQTTRSEFRT